MLDHAPPQPLYDASHSFVNNNSFKIMPDWTLDELTWAVSTINNTRPWTDSFCVRRTVRVWSEARGEARIEYETSHRAAPVSKWNLTSHARHSYDENETSRLDFRR